MSFWRNLELGGAARGRSAPDVEEGRLGSISYGLVVLFLLALYSNVALLVPALAVLSPAQSLGAAAAVSLLVERSLGRRGFDLVWPDGFLLLSFLGASALSSLTAFWPSLAVESTLDLAKMSVVHLLLVNVIESEERLRGLLWTMVVGGLFPAVGTISHYARGILIEGNRAGWIGIFVNPNELAYSLVILVPVAAALASSSSSIALRALGWGSVAVYAVGIGVSYSRGGMLGLLAVLVVMGLRLRRGLRAATLLLLAASVVYGAFFWSRDDGFTELSSDTTFQQRLTTIRAGLDMFAERPVLGVGLGCSAVAWPLFVPPESQLGGWLHIHNTFTQALSETGLLGTGPFLLLFASVLRRGERVRGGKGLGPLAAGLQASIVGFLACGLSGGYVLSWFPYLLTGLLSGAGKMEGGR